jgi:hypothetical protein
VGQLLNNSGYLPGEMRDLLVLEPCQIDPSGESLMTERGQVGGDDIAQDLQRTGYSRKTYHFTTLVIGMLQLRLFSNIDENGRFQLIDLIVSAC